MENHDKMGSLFFIIIAAGICLASLKWGEGSLELPRSMGFPLMLGLCLLFLSIVLFAQSEPSSLSSLSGLFSKGEGVKVIYLLSSFSFCVFIFEPMGYVVSIFTLSVLLVAGIGGKAVKRSILYGLLISLPTYLFFTRLLGVRLPKGILGF